MSDDALGRLLAESAELYQESDDPRSGIEYTRDYLYAHGVVVLPPDHPMRTSEPTIEMVNAGWRAWIDWAGPGTQMACALRAALAVMRKGGDMG